MVTEEELIKLIKLRRNAIEEEIRTLLGSDLFF